MSFGQPTVDCDSAPGRKTISDCVTFQKISEQPKEKNVWFRYLINMCLIFKFFSIWTEKNMNNNLSIFRYYTFKIFKINWKLLKLLKVVMKIFFCLILLNFLKRIWKLLKTLNISNIIKIIKIMKPIKFQILILIIMIWKLKKKTYVLFK